MPQFRSGGIVLLVRFVNLVVGIRNITVCHRADLTRSILDRPDVVHAGGHLVLQQSRAVSGEHRRVLEAGSQACFHARFADRSDAGVLQPAAKPEEAKGAEDAKTPLAGEPAALALVRRVRALQRVVRASRRR